MGKGKPQWVHFGVWYRDSCAETLCDKLVDHERIEFTENWDEVTCPRCLQQKEVDQGSRLFDRITRAKERDERMEERKQCVIGSARKPTP